MVWFTKTINNNMNETLKHALNEFEKSEYCKVITSKSFVLKNDRDRIKFAIEYLMEKSRAPKIILQSKNTLLAKKKIIEANVMLSSKQSLKKILKTYTQAIALAPTGSKELGLAYANRSVPLCNENFYEDSLKDISRALKTNYPDALKASLYVRRAKNLLGISPLMRPEVEEAMTNAQNYIGKTDLENRKKLLDSIALYKSPFKRPFEPPAEKWDDKNFLPKTPGGNVKIQRACDGVTIKYSETFGRHIVATRDIEAGETIIVHKAYVSTLYQERLHDYCWNCSRRACTGVPCSQCVNVIFCNENCRDKAWREYHDIECPVINAFSAETIIPIDVMALRMTIKAFKEMNTFHGLKTKIAVIDGITDHITRVFSEGTFNDTKYASVCTLMRKVEEPLFQFHYALKCACILYYLAATTEIFGKKIYDWKILLNHDQALFIGGLILRNFEICTINAIGIESNDDDGQRIAKGGQLIPFQCLFNHSCDPNAYQYTSGEMNAIIAFETIKKDEQICLSYGPGYTDLPTYIRREKLLPLHKFLCNCRACKNDWCSETDILSFTDLPLSSSTIECLNSIKKKHYKYRYTLLFDEIEDQSVKNIQKIITTLFKILNAYGEYLDEDSPCQETQILKISLTKIYNAISR